MDSGDYPRFLAENEGKLPQCGEEGACDVVLFNLGFAYVSTQSPYRDLPKASQYFAELHKKYPRSPWAFQGQAWMTLINEHLAAEEQRRQLQADLRTRDGTIRALRERLTRSRDIDVEMEKKEREILR